jgi:methionyl aminopeptidase
MHAFRPFLIGVPLPSQLGAVELKSTAEINAMRVACSLASKVRAYAGTLVCPGRTTDEIDAMVHDYIIKHNGWCATVCLYNQQLHSHSPFDVCTAYPSPLGYRGFPKSVCTSINEVVCHGIPDQRPLKSPLSSSGCSLFLLPHFRFLSLLFCCARLQRW